MKVEHDIQLTNIAEIGIEILHKKMDQLKSGRNYLEMQQLVVVDVDAHREVQPLVSLVDYLEVVELGRKGSTSMKSVCFESRPTIIRWIYDCRRTFSFSS